MPKEEDFEILLSVASDTYEQKTKRGLYYTSGYDYETFSNKEGWS